MTILAALILLAVVLAVTVLWITRTGPFYREGMHAAPRHHGRAELFDDDLTLWHAPVPQSAIDQRDAWLERGLGLPDPEPWADDLRGFLSAEDATPLTEAELARLAERFREAQTRPLHILPGTPAYLPAPVDRAPRLTAGRQAADRSAGWDSPPMVALNGRDERDYPHLRRAWADETGSFAAFDPEVSHG